MRLIATKVRSLPKDNKEIRHKQPEMSRTKGIDNGRNELRCTLMCLKKANKHFLLQKLSQQNQELVLDVGILQLFGRDTLNEYRDASIQITQIRSNCGEICAPQKSIEEITHHFKI